MRKKNRRRLINTIYKRYLSILIWTIGKIMPIKMTTITISEPIMLTIIASEWNVWLFLTITPALNNVHFDVIFFYVIFYSCNVNETNNCWEIESIFIYFYVEQLDFLLFQNRKKHNFSSINSKIIFEHSLHVIFSLNFTGE